ncbi:IS5 family transposase, partial [Salmonella enterica]
MKDQITHLPDNADRSVAKQKFKITNWPTYNKALINRGSITFWLDDEAIQAWYESATPSSRGRPQRYSDLAITTVLVIKRVFRLTLRAAQGFIDSIFSLMNVPLRCPDYSCVSRRAKSVNVSFKTSTRGEIAHLVIDSTGLKVFGEGEWKVKKHGQERRRIWRKLHLAVDNSCVSRRAKSVNVSFKTSTRGEIAHLVIDSTGLKVFGEGEWKVKKHGQERRRIWRKLHLAVDSKTHEIICADLSLNNVTDSEAFPGLIRQTHRKIRSAAADGAYDTRLCHDELRRKKISALIPPRKGAGYWPGEYADRNRAVANQRMTGSNARWKWTTDYNRRSIAETAMYRVKQLFGGSLTLRDYDGQVAEAMALVRALNKMTKAGMPESV